MTWTQLHNDWLCCFNSSPLRFGRKMVARLLETPRLADGAEAVDTL